MLSSNKLRWVTTGAWHRERVNLKGQEPEKSKAQGGKKDMSKKAVLLSGPPGIGKTSSAMIVTRCAPRLPLRFFHLSGAHEYVLVRACIGARLWS